MSTAAINAVSMVHDGPAMRNPAAAMPLRAVGWRVLVRLPEPKKQTESGIIMPDQLADKEAVAVILGEVVNVGDYCYPASKYPAGPWCKAGDWVVFRSYSGTRVMHGGREYRLLADDAIEAVTTVPDEIGRA